MFAVQIILFKSTKTTKIATETKFMIEIVMRGQNLFKSIEFDAW